jgi:hypothetical protein
MRFHSPTRRAGSIRKVRYLQPPNQPGLPRLLVAIIVVAYEFEWDPVKAAANYKKHGVRFAHAQEACEDVFALVELDDSKVMAKTASS